MSLFAGKTVLVTGACGTVGREIVSLLMAEPITQLICLDNNESELFFLNESYRDDDRQSGYVCDIRELDGLRSHMRNVDVAIHTAALKHVGLCEASPGEAVRTNIVGTQNVIKSAVECHVERVIFTSSDKAVNPTNVMGTTKLMGERLMSAAAAANENQKTIFASTRFGNVLGSRGSVVPIFRAQIETGGPITLTDRNMTRFIMSVTEAARLVLESVWLAKGGEVLVTKMPVANIKDLAQAMSNVLAPEANIEVVEVGARPGEKMYEELMNDEELRRTWDCGEFLAVLPPTANRDEYNYLDESQPAKSVYNSQNEPLLSVDDIRTYLTECGELN